MAVERQQGEWLLFNLSSQGMKSRNNEVVIPAELAESELPGYLDDLFHESATEENPEVRRID